MNLSLTPKEVDPISHLSSEYSYTRNGLEVLMKGLIDKIIREIAVESGMDENEMREQQNKHANCLSSDKC